ncbi:hypothetical protein ACL1I4_12690 [Corynebacterium striatum]
MTTSHPTPAIRSDDQSAEVSGNPISTAESVPDSAAHCYRC